MTQFLKVFWQICLLRTAPQILPASTLLLALTLIVYLLVGMVMSLLQMPPLQALYATLVDLGLLAVYTRLLLWIRLKGARYVQALTALAGSGTVLGVLALPILLWQQSLPDPTAFGVSGLLLLGWTAWSAAVTGHVFRHALSVPMPIGVGLALLYMYLAFQIMRVLFLNKA